MPRSWLAAALLLSAASLLAADDDPIATILCYHEVDPPAAQHTTIPRRTANGDAISEQLRYTASPENFAAQLDYLQQNGYHVIPLADLVAFLSGDRQSLPSKAVVITVDDGWLCSYTEIGPELRRRGMPYTLFIYPNVVGRGSHLMSWSQVKEMSIDGVDVESHTFTHPFLTLRNNSSVMPDKYAEFLQHELADSKKVIEQRTNQPVKFLSYPFGDYDDAVIEIARREGYVAAVTTQRGPIRRSTPLMTLKRYLIHNDTTLEEFKTFLLP
jgi:peptidoglycan/xylan/chitin deacetylase (PgdA/CDA1 family)